MAPSPVPDPFSSRSARMARLGGLSPGTPLAVAGPGALDTVLALCRLGYDDVLCALGHDRCTCSAEPVGGLILPAPLPDRELRETLEAAGAWLQPDAVVVVSLSDLDQDRRLQEWLAEAGLEVRSAVFDLSEATLVAHRVHRSAERRAAEPVARAA